MAIRVRRFYWRQFWSRSWTKIHLIPIVMDGWDNSVRALCGEPFNQHEARESLMHEDKHLCKRCVKAAQKQGIIV